ncbi:FadR/GntR family transcriptional regulator [Microlunatus flavus]|uniref:GntR family transcriptional regulator, transcriptional repressor for pyruvate dehydrogenase complex n=1 Tax=Microlunatus flavus TaxID=1036181 RepID=A0A1H9ATD3_9ACTN|nr:FCD domain-containing protein [Microlunatus flavus]SEP79771.1 GntR family transcriptional regulator, transcriptional repressor for pyruvate dehydrogenase complex [Microlunatus flavus]
MNDLVDGVAPDVLAPTASSGRHTFEGCVERLATAIRLGVYPYGTMLPPERELAVLLGVSRATVREAISALRSAGMVRTTRGRGGGSVVDLEPTTPGRAAAAPEARRPELLDALVFRRVVEPGACFVAASTPLTTAGLEGLHAAHAEVREAVDPAEHRQADARLHLALAGLTGSASLVAAVTQVQAAVHEMLLAIPVLAVNIEHSDAQHAEVVAAVVAGEPERARRAMEEHCDDTAALLRGLLR